MVDKPFTGHWVAIAGRVTDRQTQQPIVGAALTLVDGPPAFQSIVDVCRGDPHWEQRKVRLNHTVSRAGGVFYFIDLPDGGPYQIEVTVPHQAARYGSHRHKPAIDVAPKPASAAHPVRYQWVDVALPSTGVIGGVLTIVDGEQKPVPQATVTLQDARIVTGPDGQFALHGLIGPRADARIPQPNPRLRVTAPGFVSHEQAIALKTGVVIDDLVIILQKSVG